MDIDDEKFIKECMKEYINDTLEEFKNKINEIFKDSLNIGLYNIYTPSTYERTYNLINSVRTYIDYNNNNLYVYCDVNEGTYFSNVTNEDIGQYLPEWLMDTGHNDNTMIDNEYHNYEVRSVLGIAKNRIEYETGLVVDIVDKDNEEYNSYFI